MKIPEKTSVEVHAGNVVVKGPAATLEKRFNPRVLSVVVEGGEVAVKPLVKRTRRVHAMMNTLEAHLRNMVAGSAACFEKKLSLVYAHFPVTVEVKGKDVLIKNFLGEKTPRVAKVLGSAKVAVKAQEITVTGNDKDEVGQTASNIVKATRIVKRDVRVFQDGIYYA